MKGQVWRFTYKVRSERKRRTKTNFKSRFEIARFASEIKVPSRWAKPRFKGRFANIISQCQSRACRKCINIKILDKNYISDLQSEVQEVSGLLLYPKIHSLKCCIEDLQEG